jgi:Tol biopolymer transport system component
VIALVPLTSFAASASAVSNGRLTISRAPVQGGGVFSVSPEGRELGREPGTTRVDDSAQWSPNGRFLAFERDSEIWIRTPSGRAQLLAGRARAPGCLQTVAGWHPDGRLLVEGWTRDDRGCSLVPWLVDPVTGNGRPVGSTSCYEMDLPRLSPDGRTLAYWDSCQSNLYVSRISPWAPRRLTNLDLPPDSRGLDFGRDIAWSPDGTRIALVLHLQEDEPELRVVRVDGSGSWKVPGQADDPAWAPNGTALAYVIFPSGPGSERIELRSPAGSGRRVLVRMADQAVWAPDGRFIAYRAM